MSDFEFYANENIDSVDWPYRKQGGQLNDGTYFEITLSLEKWYKQYRFPPKKSDIKGNKISFPYEDVDSDTIKYYIGTVTDYKFVNDYRSQIRVMLEECQEVESE